MISPGPPETDLRLAKARAGDLSVLNELVMEHQGPVYGLCRRLLHREDDAEDATQEAFIAAWRHLSRLSGPFRPWLMTIAANICRSHLRRPAVRRCTSLDGAMECGLVEPASDARQLEDTAVSCCLRTTIEAAMEQLPADQRLALTLCDVEGFNYFEIAEATGWPMGTVKSRISRARMRMRVLLAPQVAASQPSAVTDSARHVAPSGRGIHLSHE